MKLIDLLIAIANGEVKEGQKFRIYFNNDMYRNCYYTRDEEKYNGGLGFIKNCSDDYEIYDDLDLNEEISLLSDDVSDDVIKSLEIPTCFSMSKQDNMNLIDFAFKNRHKINEIIDAVNELKNKKV